MPLPLDPISLVEDAMLTVLREQLAGGKLRVQSLPGDWDDDMLRRLLALAPCVLVAFSGGTPAAAGSLVAEIVSQWEVYVVTAHPSGEEARRRGNAQAPGAYQLLGQVVVPRLHGLTVPDVGSLQLTRVENLFTGMVERQGLAVYAATFTVPLSFDPITDPEQLANFATFVANLDLTPLASPEQRAAWLQGDYSPQPPDARDELNLPQ